MELMIAIGCFVALTLMKKVEHSGLHLMKSFIFVKLLYSVAMMIVAHQFAISWADSHGTDLLGADQYLHFFGCFATVYELWMVHSMMHIYAVGGHPGMQPKAILDLLRADLRRTSVHEDTVDFLIESFRGSTLNWDRDVDDDASEHDTSPLLF